MDKWVIDAMVESVVDRPKCERCLRYPDEPVEEHAYWPRVQLCQRCVSVLLEIQWPPFRYEPDGSVYGFKNEGEWARWDSQRSH